jgi:hypothetical protein
LYLPFLGLIFRYHRNLAKLAYNSHKGGADFGQNSYFHSLNNYHLPLQIRNMHPMVLGLMENVQKQAALSMLVAQSHIAGTVAH